MNQKTVLGPYYYYKQDRLGEGTSATVYRAYRKVPKAKVNSKQESFAIKILNWKNKR